MVNIISTSTVLFLLDKIAFSKALAFHIPQQNESPNQVIEPKPNNRRTFVSQTLGILTLTSATYTTQTQQAHALQERNEALCGTGFFEHFNEFKCTPIGDISDEGTTKSLSDNEMKQVDSLMGKLGMMDVEIVDDQKVSIKKEKNDTNPKREKK